jgi:hypothetical protein
MTVTAAIAISKLVIYLVGIGRIAGGLSGLVLVRMHPDR